MRTNPEICIRDRTSGSYTASDWQKRNKYTDDSLAEQVQDELQSLQIGGRNWLTNTESETVMEVNSPSGFVTTSSITTQYPPGSQTLAELGFKVGDTLTLSYDWEISNATTYGTFQTEFYGQTSSAEDYYIDMVPKSIITFSSSNTGGHLVFTFALTSSTINTKRFVFRINRSVLTFTVRNLKLEKGNKATDWSPAPEDTETYVDNIAADLQDQIDGKVQTYSQTSDPSSSWTTTALKTQHTGDLWYNPSTKLTRRWSGTAWVTLQSAEAEEAAELAQTKAQIFISTPTVPYYQGDLWFNSASSDIMTCIRDRTSGSYTASDWQKRNKYTDDSFAEEVQAELQSMQIGGTNLQQNSGFSDGFDHWAVSSTAQTYWSIDESTKLDGINTIRFSKGATTGYYSVSSAYRTISARPGEVFTASAYFYTEDKSSISGSVEFLIYFNNSDGSSQTIGGTVDVPFEEGSWIRCSVTATAGSNTSFVSIQITPGISGVFWVGKPKLERGNKPTDWSPAPQDTDTYIDDLVADLQTQVDGKVQTWYQSTDPSSAWTTSDLKGAHTGDIWYNTSSSVQKSYRWNGSSWQEIKADPPDEVFDTIDGKAQIYISQPAPPYHVGDLWFNNTTSDIMTCIRDRTSGSYTASDWQKRNKYTDDSLAEQVQDELQSLQIGGRNWLTNTESETVMEVNSPSGFVTTSSITTQYPPGSQTLAELGFKVGDTLTLSYDWEISNATTYGTFQTEFYGQTSSAEDYYIDMVPKSIITFSSSNTGGHLVFTFALTSSTINTKRFVFRINRSVLTFTVRNLKLEKGNKATDWSPAPEDTETYVDNIAADLQDQIDGKVQTYSQTSDPSSSWTTTALKTQHTGDLWYNPSTKLTRRWSGTAWVTLQSAEAEEASELAQTKAQIFISTPTVPYYQGDLWFNNTTSDIMTCIRNRTSGSYTASDWQKRNKYTDDTKANAAQQTANSALNSASSASTLANQAKSAADTANANANQASQMAAAVRQDLAVSGAVEINGGNIKSDTVNAMLVDAGVLVGLVISNGNGTFYVDAQGNLTATKATIKGNIEATGGKVGFLEIQGDTLSSNAILFQDSATDPLFILNGNTSGGIKSAVLSSKGIGFNGRNTSSTGWDITLNTNADSGTSTNYPLLEFDRYESGVRQEYLLLSKNELRKYMTSGDPDFTMSFGSMTIFFVGGDIMMMSASGKKIYINGTPF